MGKGKIIKFPTTKVSGGEDANLEWDIELLKTNWLQEVEGDSYNLWDADIDYIYSYDKQSIKIV